MVSRQTGQAGPSSHAQIKCPSVCLGQNWKYNKITVRNLSNSRGAVIESVSRSLQPSVAPSALSVVMSVSGGCMLDKLAGVAGGNICWAGPRGAMDGWPGMRPSSSQLICLPGPAGHRGIYLCRNYNTVEQRLSF